MERRQLPDPVREALRVGLSPFLLVLMLLIAYRALWLEPGTVDVDHLVFLPGRLPPGLVCGVALWLLWRRRTRLTPEVSSPPRLTILALSLASCGLFLFIWSTLTGKTDLLLPSLVALGLAVATALRGRVGLGAGLVPALVLLLGVRIPNPLEDEIVWGLQLWSARWSGRLLEFLGQDFIQSGVILRRGDHVFHVIDSCSGLNGILVLLLVAVIVRELFRERSSGPGLWLLVGAAVPLGLMLNVVRVAYVAASPYPGKLTGAEGDHTFQGLAVLMSGTVVLYGLGWALAEHPGPEALGRSREKQPPTERVTVGAAPPAGIDSSHRVGSFTPIATPSLLVAILWLCALAAFSWLLPRFEAPPVTARRVQLDLPKQKAGWTSGPAPHDLFFTGVFPSGLHRRYQAQRFPGRPPDIVDLLIGFEDVTRPSASRLISSKSSVPGPEWQIERRESSRIWLLDREAERVLASRKPGGEHALVYVWRPRDRGLALESLRALLALDLSPWHRTRPRAVVRLVAYAPHDGQRTLDRARQRLDRFTRVFREELARP